MNTFVIEFDNIDDRERFYSSGVLERHGLNEDDMESDRMSLLSCDNDAQKEITEFVKAEYNCTVYATCGGKTMNDCKDHESRCGAPCEFCQRMT